jgi:hypothetical protein
MVSEVPCSSQTVVQIGTLLFVGASAKQVEHSSLARTRSHHSKGCSDIHKGDLLLVVLDFPA